MTKQELERPAYTLTVGELVNIFSNNVPSKVETKTKSFLSKKEIQVPNLGNGLWKIISTLLMKLSATDK